MSEFLSKKLPMANPHWHVRGPDRRINLDWLDKTGGAGWHNVGDVRRAQRKLLRAWARTGPSHGRNSIKSYCDYCRIPYLNGYMP